MTSSSTTSRDIDDYLATVPEPGRSTLESLRRTIRRLAPTAVECISYRLPAFREDGAIIAGFAAFRNHLSYLPHSGSVLSTLRDELRGYAMTAGSLHFAKDTPLPEPLVLALINAKREINASRNAKG